MSHSFKIQLNNFLKYILPWKSLVSSIPKRWKEILQGAQSIVKLKENCDILPVNGVRPIKSIESKNVYQALRRKFLVSTSEKSLKYCLKILFADKLE